MIITNLDFKIKSLNDLKKLFAWLAKPNWHRNGMMEKGSRGVSRDRLEGTLYLAVAQSFGHVWWRHSRWIVQIGDCSGYADNFEIAAGG